MKFNIYYGRDEDFLKQELVNSLDNIEQAEYFLFDYIKQLHPSNGYIRINFISDTQRQYDYGHYSKYYSIAFENKESKLKEN